MLRFVLRLRLRFSVAVEKSQRFWGSKSVLRPQESLAIFPCDEKSLAIAILFFFFCSRFFEEKGVPTAVWLVTGTSALSGPVLRDTARLSQRYTPIARYGVFGVSTWPIGCDTPSPFSEPFPLGEHAKWRCDTPPPPQKGYLSNTRAIPYENKANGRDTPLCDSISKGYCAIWGGISHWAAKHLRQKSRRLAIAMFGALSPHPIEKAAQYLPKGCSRKMPPSSSSSFNGVVGSNALFSNASAP